MFSSGSNDKSVIIWDVRGEIDINAVLDDSAGVSDYLIVIARIIIIIIIVLARLL